MEPILNALWAVVMILWPALVTVGVFLVVLFVFKVIIPTAFNRWRLKVQSKKGEEWRDDQQLLEWLRDKKPSEFEEYTVDLFNRMGFHAKAVGRSHDGGIDVEAEKDGTIHYIQCKKYKGSVGEPAMRDFYGALAGKFAKGTGYFVTTGHFTREAEAFAEDKPIELVDGVKIVRWHRKFGSGTEKSTRTEGRRGPPDLGPIPHASASR